jgi:hypothetical protein
MEHQMAYFPAQKFALLQTLLLDYLNAVNDVSRYALSISQTNLPVMANAPSWYTEFFTGWVNVKTDALVWVNSTAPIMQSTLTTGRDDNLLVWPDLQSAAQLIADLAVNPNDPDKKSLLVKTLANVATLIGGIPGVIDGLQKMLSDFAATVQTDADKIAKAVADAQNQVGIDNTKIATLKADIQSLRDAIQAYNQVIQNLDQAEKAGIFIGAVGLGIALFSGGAGAVIFTVGVAMVGGSEIGKIILNKQIADAGAKIAQDGIDIGDLNTQIAVLQQLQVTLNDLLALSATAQAALVVIENFWTEFLADFNAFATALSGTQGDVNADSYAAAQSEIAACMAGWQAFQNFIAPLSEITVTYAAQPVMLGKAA